MPWLTFEELPPVGSIVLLWHAPYQRPMLVQVFHAHYTVMDRDYDRQYSKNDHPFTYWCDPGRPGLLGHDEELVAVAGAVVAEYHKDRKNSILGKKVEELRSVLAKRGREF